MSRRLSSIPIRARQCLMALPAVLLAVPLALLAHAPARAQSLSASTSFTVKNVRPEAFSWFWDNLDEAMLKAANSENKAFRWTQPPATPEHLGYSAGARYRTTSVFGLASHTVEVSYLDPDTVRGRVASDNYLGIKPYSFVAQSVSVDGKPPFTVLVQYNPVGSDYTDSAVRIEATLAAQPALAQAYVTHLRKTLTGLQPTLMGALNERYFNAVLKTRGRYTIGPVDKNLNVTLVIEQEIKGVTAEMLAWWWDHIGDTSRYRLWQPIDHVSFEWTVPPNSPDTHYDIGAVQKAKEYIGKSALTLNIKGADPAASPPPPVPVSGDDYFYARTDLTLIAGLLPSNSLVHQWRPNASGDGVILTSTFVNTALARVLNFTFFDDLGSHCLREFQMLPYFLPRLYKREYLHQ